MQYHGTGGQAVPDFEEVIKQALPTTLGSLVGLNLVAVNALSSTAIKIHCPKSPGRLPAITGMALGQSSRDGTSTTFFSTSYSWYHGTKFLPKSVLATQKLETCQVRDWN